MARKKKFVISRFFAKNVEGSLPPGVRTDARRKRRPRRQRPEQPKEPEPGEPGPSGPPGPSLYDTE